MKKRDISFLHIRLACGARKTHFREATESFALWVGPHSRSPQSKNNLLGALCDTAVKKVISKD